MKRISVFTPVFNEEANVRRCYEQIRETLSHLSDRYDYEHIFADNNSSDNTLEILRELAREDSKVRVLAYSRNFGAEKSSFAAMQHCSGDAAVGISADLQEPPEMILKFVELWEKGYQVVYGTYKNPHEAFPLRFARRFYYFLVDRLSAEHLPHDFTGFALMDRVVVDEVCAIDDFSPYIRGLIATVGFRQIGLSYEKKPRIAGISKHRLSFLLDFGLNGIISHSIVPIRLATLVGLSLALISFAMAIGYVVMKLINWQFQAPGATTTIALLLFFSGIQLLFLGILGEYIGAIHGQVRRKPFVVIREQINFDPPRTLKQHRRRSYRNAFPNRRMTSATAISR